MAKRSLYFQHDFGARNDPKLMAVQKSIGLDGVGFFWCVLELLYEQGGTLDLQAADDLAYQLHFDAEKAKKVITEFGLFEIDGNKFFSPSARERLSKTMTIAEKRRNAANTRWNDKQHAETKITPNRSCSIDFQRIQTMFNETCKSYSKVMTLSDERKKKIKARITQMDTGILQGYQCQSVYDLFMKIFQKLESSDFCKGMNDKNWKADFDWIIDSPSHWQKVIEGRYDNRKQKTTSTSAQVNQKWK